MISNASLLRIDRIAGGDVGGEPIITTGPDLTAAPGGPPRCFLDSVSSSQRFTQGATIKDAGQVCYLLKNNLSAADEAAPKDGDVFTLKMDEDAAATTMEVVSVNNRSKAPLSHFEVFLKQV